MPRRLISLALACAPLLVSVGASAASAATVDLAHGRSAYGAPALAGERVAASTVDGREAFVLVAKPGSPATRLLAIKSVPADTSLAQWPTGGQALFEYAGSAERLVVKRTVVGERQEVFAGSPAGPLSALPSCPQAGAAGPLARRPVFGTLNVLAYGIAPAADGRLVAYVNDACRERVRIDDAAPGGSGAEVDAGGTVQALAVGGRFVAWLALPDPRFSAARLVVYDASAHAVAYDVLLSPDVRWAGGLDVQADGTVALTASGTFDRERCGGRGVTRIVVVEPATRIPRTLPPDACSPHVRIAGGRIAFIRSGPAGGYQLTLADLAGGELRPVANFAADWAFNGHEFDWDGTRVAWNEVRCSDYVLRVRAAADTSPLAPATTCPARLSSRVTLSDDGIRVRVSCPHGCSGAVRVEGPSWLRHPPDSEEGSASVELARGRHATVALSLDRGQVARLRRGHTRTIRLASRSLERDLVTVARRLTIR